ncbi:TRAP transporter small permease [Pseudooceanicola sediminis]|uniref:TRAP transporter small permease protein n=1 Tax=Pseudooceanicola sediminis TaxID=2211117 RepID=A0A399J3Z9_9RHOB|nr:TRAP transporter small permease [Pseudooceanicola sediminis]KAA2314709.1 TRAP transporter small permease [Puniceibacterium sp. HSS470]RII39337.1 TRAP transporter small permease [Pseudooceanicola sediminis]|tara:strand:- start:186865 stop:187377 length:513 start_codon:yes stop_codon:yes gene_type:complete
MYSSLKRLADGLINLSSFLGTLGLIFVTSTVLVDVIGRFFGAPLRGAQDFTQMGMVIIVFGGMALCDRLGGHVAVDIFESKFSRGMNHAFDIFAALLGAVIFLAIAYTVYDSSKLSQMLNLATNIVRLPKWYFQWALSLLAVITALGMVLRAVELMLAGPHARAQREIRE